MPAFSNSYIMAASKGDWLAKLPLGAVSEIRGGSGQTGAKKISFNWGLGGS